MELWLGTGVSLLAAVVFGAVTYVAWSGTTAFREVHAEEQPRQDARLVVAALSGPAGVVFFLVLAAGLHWHSGAWVWLIGTIGLADVVVVLSVVLFGRPAWLVPSPYRPWTGLLDRPNRRATASRDDR